MNAQFSIEPNLPQGLSLNPQTGIIMGNPLVNSTEIEYTITYANIYGEDSVMIRLIVYEPAANIVYPVSDIVLTRSGQSIQYAPLVTNGSVLEWSIMPQLPLGLYFDNGLIYGQPSSNQSSTMYRVW